MPQCRGPVVHKICIRKLNRYVFILKILREEEIGENLVKAFIRRAINTAAVLLNFSISFVKGQILRNFKYVLFSAS